MKIEIGSHSSISFIIEELMTKRLLNIPKLFWDICSPLNPLLSKKLLLNMKTKI